MTDGIKFLTDFQQRTLQWPGCLLRGNGGNVLAMELASCFSHRHRLIPSPSPPQFWWCWLQGLPSSCTVPGFPSWRQCTIWRSTLSACAPSGFFPWLASWQKLIALLFFISFLLVLFWRCQKSFAFSTTNKPFMVHFCSSVKCSFSKHIY